LRLEKIRELRRVGVLLRVEIAVAAERFVGDALRFRVERDLPGAFSRG